MKQLSLFIILIGNTIFTHAQNVGIGTTSPTYPLTVIGNSSGKGIIQKTGDVEVGFYTSGTNAYLQTWSNHNLLFATNNQSAAMTLTTNGNLGIGVASPAQKLHVEGNAAFSGNVGIGTTSPAQKLHVVGIAAFSGNVGIGTSAPSTNLDINGGLRIRGTFPKKGSVLTSDDTNGNANWADPVAFKTTGLDNLANANFPEDVWTKVEFNKSPAFNLSLGYQPLNSQFQAIDGGVYHFDAQFICDVSQVVSTLYVRMVLNRNGNLSTIAQRSEVKLAKLSDGSGAGAYSIGSISLNTDILLQSGDIVWLELNPNGPLNWIDLSNRSNLTLLGSASSAWFSGHLVARN